MVGGAVGAALRYGVGLLTAGWRPMGLPGGTMAVNVAGCLILGVAAGLVARSSMAEPWSVMLTAGFCGALTTFSTFSGGDCGAWWRTAGRLRDWHTWR